MSRSNTWKSPTHCNQARREVSLPKFQTERRVEFADTDAAGICHFASFIRYMEEAEHAMLRSAGLGVLHHEVDGQQVSWPRVSVQCDYQRPARFEDVLQLEVWVSRLGTKSATFTCEFHHDGHPIATGKVTAACCIVGAGGQPQAIAIPPSYLAELKRFQA